MSLTFQIVQMLGVLCLTQFVLLVALAFAMWNAHGVAFRWFRD